MIVHASGGATTRRAWDRTRHDLRARRVQEHADAPELRILSADFDGQLDLSPAFFQQLPRGTITGKYSARGEQGSIMDGYKIQEASMVFFAFPS
jgi:hypothetical protein